MLRMIYSRSMFMFGFMIVLITGCNFNLPEATPTVDVLEVTLDAVPDQETPPADNTLTPTPGPSLTPRQIVLAILDPTNTLPPPTVTPTPTETPGPHEHVVQPGDTLTSILLQRGITNPAVIREVVALNPNVPNEDSLPVGETILIPRPTATPTPQGFEATQTVVATSGTDIPRAISANTQIDCHTVVEGETIISIAELYNTTIEVLSELNLEINFSSCDFSNRSGGEGCNVLLRIDQCVRVPFPTPTPTMSPTPSGSETPTLTPTFSAPRVISPPDGWTVSGAVTLSWVSAGVLQPDEYYFIELINTDSSDDQFTTTVKETTFDLPLSRIPASGQALNYQWRVFVVRVNDAGTGYTLVGSDAPYRTFKWQG